MKMKFTILTITLSFALTSIAICGGLSDDTIARFEKADAELEKLFQAILIEIKNEHKNDPMLEEWIEQISRSQKLWMKFRDEDQQTAGFFWRGGGTGRAQTDWSTRLTLQRIEDLKKRYDPR